MILLVSKYNSAMRKAILVVLPLFIWGCEPTYDNVIDTSTENYQVTSILGIKETINLYESPSDSVLNLRLILTPESEVNQVYFSVYASDNSQLHLSPIQMVEDSVNEFENQFILLSQNPNGIYTIKFSITGLDGKNRQVAISNFNFINGQDTLPPVISNTVIDPDTVVVTQPTTIFTSVEAMDPNGSSDILQVYFKVYKPDGTTNNTKIELFDDGNISIGDQIAGDGVYSRLIQVDQTNDKGTYRFEFQAEDRSGELSNILNHFVLIQ